jgi:Zn-dependent protease
VKSPSGRAITHGPAGPRQESAIDTLNLAFVADLPPIAMGLVIAMIVISLGAHEAAHGWVALKCGDPTARDLGRITLNPLPHIDPFMTILLPAICMMTGGFLIGGAKPVPVNYYNLRSPLRDMALVAIAGPASNFVLAALFFLAHKVMVYELGFWDEGALGPLVLEQALVFNLVLSAFNLLPIPPLDGSRVMTWLLPSGLRETYAGLERFGLILVVLFVFLVPGVSGLVQQTMQLMLRGIQAMVTLGGAW